jgi:hypothetical protein
LPQQGHVQSMTRLSALVAAAVAASALACTKEGRSLVLIDVAKGTTASDEARLLVVQGDPPPLGFVDADFLGATDVALGVYLPATVTGTVNAVACGYVNQTLVASGTTQVLVTPGHQANGDTVMLATSPLSDSCPPTISPVGGADAGNTDAAAGTGGVDAGGAGTGASAGMDAGGAGVGGTGGGAAGAGGGAGTAGGGGGGGAAGTSGGHGGAGGGGGGGAGAGGTGGTTLVPTWGAAQVVSNNSALAETNPAVAVSSTGKAVAVFQFGAGISANTYDPATNSWGTTPVKIDARGQTASSPRIAVDKNDNYLVVWAQDPNQALKGVWWSSSEDGVTWSTPAAITTTAAMSPALSMNPDGVAVVGWTEATSDYWQIGASFRPAPGMAWTTPVTLKAGFGETDDRDAAVAVSGKGEAFVLWHQDDMGAADEDSIFEMHHTAAGWSVPALFETYDDGPCFAPSVSANAAGVVIATWLQVSADGSSETIRARRWAFGGDAFGAPVDVATTGVIDNFVAPALAVDPTGNAIVAWGAEIQQQFQLYAGRIDGTSALPLDIWWMEMDDAATDDPDDASQRALEPALAVDPAGNVTVVWRKAVAVNLPGMKLRFDAWSQRLPAGADTWTTAVKIETRDIGSVEWPAVAAGSDGTVVAAWNYTVETDVWAAVLR